MICSVFIFWSTQVKETPIVNLYCLEMGGILSLSKYTEKLIGLEYLEWTRIF